VALAWVLAQSFPSYALVGPRTVEEVDSLLPALQVSLSADEVAWLNLER
jgi:aryl-alcohol dehydrogenase-like predicted oxidoreductase